MKIFLSSPVSTFANRALYARFREWLLDLCVRVEHLGDGNTIYCVARRITNLDELDEPSTGIGQDLSEIRKSDLFILLYPIPSPTSALIELGFALSLGIKILAIAPEKEILPYMARHIDSVFPKQAKVLACPIFSERGTKGIIEAISNF